MEPKRAADVRASALQPMPSSLLVPPADMPPGQGGERWAAFSQTEEVKIQLTP